jgi:hypothetical protein
LASITFRLVLFTVAIGGRITGCSTGPMDCAATSRMASTLSAMPGSRTRPVPL